MIDINLLHSTVVMTIVSLINDSIYRLSRWGPALPTALVPRACPSPRRCRLSRARLQALQNLPNLVVAAKTRIGGGYC